MKILIVDEDPGMIEAITIGLQLQGHEVEVISAPNGEAGLDRFLEESPDLTLLDVNTDHLSGWEMLRRAREVSSAPILILTAGGDPLNKVKGLELGADDY